jgi:Pyruvate/2-oxoacid:ferredoxin oxidoreductase delta subunit
MKEFPDILVCRCAYDAALPSDRVRAVIGALDEAGLPHRIVPDLCELAAKRDPWLLEWAGSPGRKIVACYPRAVLNLLRAAGAASDRHPPEIVNLHAQTGHDACRQLALRPGADGPGHADADKEPTDWVPWFPVVDVARCTACRQCLDFCLFGVYVEPQPGRIEVRHPDRCKLHCPACARICPESAIIFPKHGEAPINGAEITDVQAERARIHSDLLDLLGDDFHAALKERSRRVADARRARAEAGAAPAPRLLNEELVKRALAERERHRAAHQAAAERDPS